MNKEIKNLVDYCAAIEIIITYLVDKNIYHPAYSILSGLNKIDESFVRLLKTEEIDETKEKKTIEIIQEEHRLRDEERKKYLERLLNELSEIIVIIDELRIEDHIKYNMVFHSRLFKNELTVDSDYQKLHENMAGFISDISKFINREDKDDEYTSLIDDTILFGGVILITGLLIKFIVYP